MKLPLLNSQRKLSYPKLVTLSKRVFKYPMVVTGAFFISLKRNLEKMNNMGNTTVGASDSVPDMLSSWLFQCLHLWKNPFKLLRWLCLKKNTYLIHQKHFWRFLGCKSLTLNSISFYSIFNHHCNKHKSFQTKTHITFLLPANKESICLQKLDFRY